MPKYRRSALLPDLLTRNNPQSLLLEQNPDRGLSTTYDLTMVVLGAD